MGSRRWLPWPSMLLQVLHSGLRLPGTDCPPCHRGVMWPMVSGLPGVPPAPQRWHTEPGGRMSALSLACCQPRPLAVVPCCLVVVCPQRDRARPQVLQILSGIWIQSAYWLLLKATPYCLVIGEWLQLYCLGIISISRVAFIRYPLLPVCVHGFNMVGYRVLLYVLPVGMVWFFRRRAFCIYGPLQQCLRSACFG